MMVVGRTSQWRKEAWELRFDIDHSSGAPGVFRREGSRVLIDARSLHHRELNSMVQRVFREGVGDIEIDRVSGHPYIGTGLRGRLRIKIRGDVGDDLGALMEGPDIEVEGSAGRGLGNGMRKGRIVVRGDAGEGAGTGMKGGRMFIEGDVGPRAALHMQELWYGIPVMVVGGMAGDLLGEYMAGGVVVVLGLNPAEGKAGTPVGIGYGMSGGAIYFRGPLRADQVAEGARLEMVEGEGLSEIASWIREFAELFEVDPMGILAGKFSRVTAARE